MEIAQALIKRAGLSDRVSFFCAPSAAIIPRLCSGSLSRESADPLSHAALHHSCLFIRVSADGCGADLCIANLRIKLIADSTI